MCSKVYVKWLVKLYAKVNSVDTFSECVVMNNDLVNKCQVEQCILDLLATLIS
jgi:hypothetical protein